MKPWEFQRSTGCVRHLAEAAGARGVSIELLLTGTGLSAATFADPTATVAPWQELRLVQNLADVVSHTRGLGLELGRRSHISAYGPAGLAALSVHTVRGALDFTREFAGLSPILCQVKQIDELRTRELRFSGERLPLALRRVIIERDVAAVLTALREITDVGFRNIELELAFPTDDTDSLWFHAFGLWPTFDTGSTRLVVPAEVLDAPLPQADPHVALVAMRDCAELLERRRSETSVVNQVLERLLHSESSLPTLDDLSRSLMTTTRTLRRRLAAEGTSFRRLIEQVRLASAADLLTAGRLSVEQVAQQVGYSDTSAFSHAFRRWTGITPRAYRLSRTNTP